MEVSMRKFLLASAALSLGLASPLAAHHEGETTKAGSLVISHAWMYENAGMGHSTSVFLTIDNQGEAADRLIAAEAAFADHAVLQAQTLSPEGVLEVKDVAAVQVNPGQVLTLKPGVVWLELESVHQTFEHGEHFDLTLTFEKAGRVEVEVEIEPLEEHEGDHEDDKDDLS
jgi:copper(I)-binding protein